MLTFLMKDLLLFWRDRKEVLTVILLPLVLVVVLSISMAGLFDENQSDNYDLALSLVMEDHQSKAIEEFKASVHQSDRIPDNGKQEVIAGVEEHPPVESLMDFLTSPELENLLTVETMSKGEAKERIENGESNAMLLIPEGYTAQLLKNIYLDQGTAPSLQFSAKETAVEVDMIHDVIDGFLEQLNLQYVVSMSGGEVSMNQVEHPEGGTEVVDNDHSFSLTMDQYFALSIGALFVLFMASTVASRTGIEKREHTFNRIALTNTPGLHFLFGKTCATFVLSLLQILLIFIGSHLILGVFSERSFTFWMGMIFMASVYALAIAGLSSIMTSVSLRLKNPDAADGIFMTILMVFGTIGGNFIPIYVLPNWLQQIGEWTPNGLTLAILIEWLQFEDVSTLWLPAIRLLGLTLIAIGVSTMLYPRRGEIS
ncbi:ABC transporter permease [Halobacillus karajensis]|uniref:ABC transporter efflux protein, DrrB family n=1 Tax=Halobacillus karajensis TaxID=195088 RepID=A0A024P455_9BACI|nr:ABC transporter permease [Halobacillus karajensis]CDQ20706.1 ABC transporter efflux protein, DrrB family [Halobacillus karajensis]CDQ23824.1 ABC transporter efflux protein, DrrB family [Halobacillus karajensis]CDQ27302.1 ABC transporter efflux protein, DrrB family [Halobacillus karajensis]